ncbi:MAG: ATP-binding protein [Methanoregula sp.]|nr:ATP-binding protein [Methanoregula sp.]
MKSRFRNARILTILFIFLMFFVTGFSFILIDITAKDAILDATRNDLKGTASIIASQINGDTFVQIQPGDESTPQFTSLRSTLETIRQSDPSIRYIYTMRQNGSAVEFVVDADYGIETDAAIIGEVYPNFAPNLLTGFLQPSAGTEFITDKWGTTLSGYAPIRDGSGRVVGLVGVDMDSQKVVGRLQYISLTNYALLLIILVFFLVGAILTDLHRTRVETMIEQAIVKLNILNNIIRHDIFNTLTALIGYEEMAQQTDTMPEVQKKLITITALTEKIQQQITFTRDYQNLGLSMPQWLNVQKIVTQVVPVSGKTEITITIDFGNLEIFANPLLERVFHHLIDNSIQYGQTLTMIHGYYERSGAGIILIIEDDGIGIPAEEKDAIFKRQFYKNAGLGLFLAQEILAMTNFSIRETGEPGKGARFEILVPKGAWRISNVQQMET